MGEERVFEDGRKRYKTFVDEYEINIRNLMFKSSHSHGFFSTCLTILPLLLS